MAYIGKNSVRTYRQRNSSMVPIGTTELGIDLWPFGKKKTDAEKAAETLAYINKAIQDFKRAHEAAVILYRAGQLSEKLRKKHVELRDKINNQLLIKIMNAVSPQEYLEIHNYLANVRKDVGLAIAPLILLGVGILIVSALYSTAKEVSKAVENHGKEVQAELLQSGKLSKEEYLELQKQRDSSGGDSWLQKLTGIDPAPLVLGGVLIFFGPQILSMIQSARKKG